MSVILGVVLVVLGACLKWAIFPAVVTSMINSQLKLTPDNGETWDAWVGGVDVADKILIIVLSDRASSNTLHEVYIFQCGKS